MDTQNLFDNYCLVAYQFNINWDLLLGVLYFYYIYRKS
jgi:hypothetical protein